MTKKNPKTYSQYIGRLYPDEEYERAKADLERYEYKYPDWEKSLAKYKGKADGVPKSMWHLRIWNEEEL